MNGDKTNYLGCANRDTWEAFNILINDKKIFNDISLHAKLDDLAIFIVKAIENIHNYYRTNDIDSSLALNFNAVDFEELKKRIKTLSEGAK